MFRNLIIILFLIKNCRSKIVVQTSSTINLIENTPVKTFVVSLNELVNFNKHQKQRFELLNLNGYERKYFRIENETIYTNDWIDREEFLEKNFCSNEFYCQIELHILTNDNSFYLIIPIHILE